MGALAATVRGRVDGTDAPPSPFAKAKCVVGPQASATARNDFASVNLFCIRFIFIYSFGEAGQGI
jgi:hypothetical protein